MGTARFTNITDLATFCAQLVKDGIAFNVTDASGYYLVEMTGY
jgi:hypothetical protein